MRRSARVLLGLLAGVGLPAGACTTTYTEADLAAEERKMDADARFEELRDQNTADEGGTNREAIEEQIEWAEEDSEL